MQQFQVPQFIDVEDKILGPITMRQFFIMLIPFGTGILLYFVLKFWIMIIITVPVTIGAAIFAFYKPYGMKFSRFFSSFIAYSIKPHMYLWRREEQARVVFESAAKETHAKGSGKAIGKGNLKAKKSTVETGSAYRET